MARLIQVMNWPASIDSLVLQKLFELHGAVRSSMIAKHLETGCSTDVVYVEMESEEAGAAAIAALNHQKHYDHVLSVGWSEKTDQCLEDRRQMFGPMNMMSDELMGK
jgi:hypothetical protein